MDDTGDTSLADAAAGLLLEKLKATGYLTDFKRIDRDAISQWRWAGRMRYSISVAISEFDDCFGVFYVYDRTVRFLCADLMLDGSINLSSPDIVDQMLAGLTEVASKVTERRERIKAIRS